jgi:hypothetical protein
MDIIILNIINSGVFWIIVYIFTPILLIATIVYGKKYPILKIVSLMVFVLLPLAFAGWCVFTPGHM